MDPRGARSFRHSADRPARQCAPGKGFRLHRRPRKSPGRHRHPVAPAPRRGRLQPLGLARSFGHWQIALGPSRSPISRQTPPAPTPPISPANWPSRSTTTRCTTGERNTAPQKCSSSKTSRIWPTAPPPKPNFCIPSTNSNTNKSPSSSPRAWPRPKSPNSLPPCVAVWPAVWKFRFRFRRRRTKDHPGSLGRGSRHPPIPRRSSTPRNQPLRHRKRTPRNPARTRNGVAASGRKNPANQHTASAASTLAARCARLRPSLQQIASCVAKFFGLRRSQLCGSSRRQQVAFARSIAIYLGRQLTGKSLQALGTYFGGRDHTTILHSYRTLEARLAHDRQLRSTVLNFRKMLTPGTTTGD